MADAWVDVEELAPRLNTFFTDNHAELARFGSTINQTFEAFVLAQVIRWFQDQPAWRVEIVNPEVSESGSQFRLKFSTRGRPAKYTYVRCSGPNGEVVQIRHQLRVATRYHRLRDVPAANVCLDVAIIKDVDLDNYSTSDFVANADLISFGEAKHMSAFAELIAGFIGLVHELQPERLRRVRSRRSHVRPPEYPSPFLFVSGRLWYTAEGIVRTIERRRYDPRLFTTG